MYSKMIQNSSIHAPNIARASPDACENIAHRELWAAPLVVNFGLSTLSFLPPMKCEDLTCNGDPVVKSMLRDVKSSCRYSTNHVVGEVVVENAMIVFVGNNMGLASWYFKSKLKFASSAEEADKLMFGFYYDEQFRIR